MENVSNVSSEEELLQLRNEGKISEDEYGELLETLRKSAKVDVGPAGPGESKPVSTSGLAIASLVFSLIVPIGCIPALICGHLALGKMKKEPASLQLTDMNAQLVLNFLDYLENERGNAQRSRNLRLAAIRSFMCYASY